MNTGTTDDYIKSLQAEIERLRNDYEIQMRKTDVAQLECERLRALAADLMDLVNEMPVKHPQQDTRRKILMGQCKQFGVNEQSASDQLKECDGCGRKMPDLRCPECRNA